MGRKWQRKRNDKRKNKDKGEQDSSARGRTNWTDLNATRECALMAKYYAELGLVPEAETESFWSTMRRSLPTTFRITASTRAAAAELRQQFEAGHFAQLAVCTSEDGEETQPPKPLPWYPENLGWQLVAPRRIIRREPSYRRLHDFLVSQTGQGNISRQEAVSMIPVLLLDAQRGHAVLDTCAAPGSKTCQIVEAVTGTDAEFPAGVVVANDAEYTRCYTLVHQTKRLQSAIFLVTNHDASRFPSLRIHDEAAGAVRKLQFDRVLCDVPCSGDGTLRKNLTIWRSWSPYTAIGLHPLQLRILQRGVDLLRPGGRIVYSTCSINPLENEAVVAEILRKNQGVIQLLDMSAALPGLVRRPGISSWKMMSKDGEFFSEDNLSQAPSHLQQKTKPSMWPPTAEEAEWMHLERCWRLMPQDQDTGAFFVAVLAKAAESKADQAQEAEAEAMAMADVDEADAAEVGEMAASAIDPAEAEGEDRPDGDNAGEPVEMPEPLAAEDDQDTAGAKDKKPTSQFVEDAFYFMTDHADQLQSLEQICEYYGLSEAFPKANIFTRTRQERQRHIYIGTDLVCNILRKNSDKRLKMVYSGVRIFSRTDSDVNACQYRLCQEGLQLILPFVTKRIVPCPAQDILTILRRDNPFFSELSPEIAALMPSFGQGSMIFVARKGQQMLTPGADGQPRVLEADVAIACWCGAKSVRCMVIKADRLYFMLLIGTDSETLAVEEAKLSKSAKTSKLDAATAAASNTDDKAAVAEVSSSAGATAAPEAAEVDGEASDAARAAKMAKLAETDD